MNILSATTVCQEMLLRGSYFFEFFMPSSDRMKRFFIDVFSGALSSAISIGIFAILIAYNVPGLNGFKRLWLPFLVGGAFGATYGLLLGILTGLFKARTFLKGALISVILTTILLVASAAYVFIGDPGSFVNLNRSVGILSQIIFGIVVSSVALAAPAALLGIFVVAVASFLSARTAVEDKIPKMR